MSDKIPNRKTYQKSDKPVEEVKRLIASLDLKPIIENGLAKTGYDPELLDYAASKYRNFLFLCATTGEVIVPTHDIDLVWHTHILDTLKYQADCEQIFGFYLHHFPYFGLQGDEAEFKAAFRRSSQLYEAQFGEAYELGEAIQLDPKLASKLDSGGRSCG